jgi:hypothetical protein
MPSCSGRPPAGRHGAASAADNSRSAEAGDELHDFFNGQDGGRDKEDMAPLQPREPLHLPAPHPVSRF